MVVDEELKMMCDLCHEGGQVLGPFLKPMTHLVHTEYLLAGRTDRDPARSCATRCTPPRSPARPVENACRLIKQYETEGRGYYGAALALFGRDADGEPLDGQPDPDPHRRRRPRRAAEGHRRRDAGARLATRRTRWPRRTRRPAASSAPSAWSPRAPSRQRRSPRSPATRTCCSRSARATARLSRFWLTDQDGAPPDPRLHGQERRDPRRRGRLREHAAPRARRPRHDQSTVVRHEDDRRRGAVSTASTWSSSGPGPGDPRDGDHPKIAALPRAPSTGCCERAALPRGVPGPPGALRPARHPARFKDIVFQGTQSPVPIDGRTERVGFYNTFVGRVGADRARCPTASRSSATRQPATSTC